MLNGMDFLAFLASSPDVWKFDYQQSKSNSLLFRKFNNGTGRGNRIEADKSEETFGRTGHYAREPVREKTSFAVTFRYFFRRNSPIFRISWNLKFKNYIQTPIYRKCTMFKNYTINGTANDYKNDNGDVDESEDVCKNGWWTYSKGQKYCRSKKLLKTINQIVTQIYNF